MCATAHHRLITINVVLRSSNISHHQGLSICTPVTSRSARPWTCCFFFVSFLILFYMKGGMSSWKNIFYLPLCSFFSLICEGKFSRTHQNSYFNTLLINPMQIVILTLLLNQMVCLLGPLKGDIFVIGLDSYFNTFLINQMQIVILILLINQIVYLLGLLKGDICVIGLDLVTHYNVSLYHFCFTYILSCIYYVPWYWSISLVTLSRLSFFM